MPLISNPAVRRDIPQPSEPDATVWGSDAIAEMLRAMDIPYVLLNPGASFRGLHDSLVNHLGNEKPQMVVVLHEEHAVAIAHGYAKVTGQPLIAILHSNVGLMHGSMAIFDAWVDRVPVIVLGATGPVDAHKRRPWIDWIHTAQDQGALVRNFTKWDAQPASIPSAQEALLRARQIATTAPQGPVYVCFDAALQESKLAERPVLPDPARYLAPAPARPSDEVLAQAAAWLSGAQRPVILMGRVNRDEQGWQQRVLLAESLQAEVLTDLRVGAAFPTDHPLHAAPAGAFLNPAAQEVLRNADVVLSLDWLDLAGTLKQAWGEQAV
ncbi:thiamine pyrophosphate-binding protein, partial [Variovorax sp. HJSM1_2]|uniref:thiamine pyrophosphate-binding protein n=1 Tax=Variovorax sp. HJSM1_2 TaxID=3366263 RepID=UPI003BD51734